MQRILDFLLAVTLLFLGPFLWLYSRLGPGRLSYTRRILDKFGVDIERIHYYTASRKYSHHRHLTEVRRISDKFMDNQIQSKNLSELPNISKEEILKYLKDFNFSNGFFMSGDIEILFLTIVKHKPSRIIEIGSGFSTKVMLSAIEYMMDNAIIANRPEIICIEPFEKEWLDEINSINLVRQRLEEIDLAIFDSLGSGDMLFIDSSHIISEGNDVDLEFLSIIPRLNSGVVIHIHDIFTPYPYLYHWRANLNRKWNEQYLLEALMTGNDKLEVLYGLYFLSREAFEVLRSKAELITEDREPTSFYIKVK